ncbi:MAG: acylphosphatase [Anaerolineales bacterium]|nr:acylphosphatase [Anaerolineales bacterium]
MGTTQTEKLRVHIWVKGRVQGVGFRSHVEYNALQIGVFGWVRNIGYDTVEVVAEGTKFQIDEFIQIVKQGPRVSRVDEAKVEYEQPTGMLEGFTVKRSM